MVIGLTTMLEKSEALFASDHASVVSMNLFVALLCACIVLGHLLEETRWMNESITALIIVISFFFLFPQKLCLETILNLNIAK